MGIENPVHLLFIAIVALVVLGPRRLPELARALGKGIREFRESISAEAEPDVPEAEPDVPEAEPDVPEAEPDVPEAEPDVPEAEPTEQEAATEVRDPVRSDR